MIPSRLVSLSATARKPSRSPGETLTGTTTPSCPRAAKAAVMPPGDFTCAIGSPTVTLRRVAPVMEIMLFSCSDSDGRRDRAGVPILDLHHAEQARLEVVVLLQPDGVAREGDLAVHQHVGAIGDGQHRLGMVLDEHHRDP